MHPRQEVLDRLKRRYEYLKSIPPEKFIFEYKNFFDFLLEDPVISQFVQVLQTSFDNKFQQYENELKKEEKEAIKIKNQFLLLYPEQDDTKTTIKPAPGEDSYNYEFTFKFFKELQSPKYKDTSTIADHDISDDETKVRKMFRILYNKMVPFCKDKKEAEKLLHRLYNLKHKHEITQKQWLVTQMSAPGLSMKILLALHSNITSEFQEYPYMEPDLNKRSLRTKSKGILSVNIKNIIYSESKYHGKTGGMTPDRLKKFILDVLELLQEVYLALIDGITEELSRDAIMIRYKQRVENFLRHEYLHIQESGSEVENNFTLKNALFLFDIGINTVYRLKKANGEYDLTQSDEVINPLFVESKIYGKDGSETYAADVYKWYNQCVLYVMGENIKTRTIYLVTYHLGGRRIQLPKEVKLGDYIIKHINISIASSEEAPSRAKRILNITEKDIIEAFREETKTRTKDTNDKS